MNYHIPRSEVSNGKVSHKLAERRRRRELKALFEELRREVPAIRNHSKASKWDILNAGTFSIYIMRDSQFKQTFYHCSCVSCGKLGKEKGVVEGEKGGRN